MKTNPPALPRILLLVLLLLAVGCQQPTPIPVEPTAPPPTAQPGAEAGTEAGASAGTETAAPTDSAAPTVELPQTQLPPAAGKDPAPIHTALPVKEQAQPNLAVRGIHNLLELRSLKLTLSVDWSDGSMRRFNAEVDGRGSLHLQEQAENSPGIYPEMPDPALMSAARETYRVDGKLYRQDGETSAWTALDEATDPLVRLLNGSTGPGLWLRLLPDAAFNPQGEEPQGGFSTQKYAVAGTIEDAQITGTVWVDSATGALVKAELSIPGSLLAAPTDQDPGEMTIKLEAAQAEVAEIQAP